MEVIGSIIKFVAVLVVALSTIVSWGIAGGVYAYAKRKTTTEVSGYAMIAAGVACLIVACAL